MATENYWFVYILYQLHRNFILYTLVFDWTYNSNLYPFKMKSWKLPSSSVWNLNRLRISETVSEYDETVSHEQ